MKAHQGDRIIRAVSHLDAPTMDGDVLEVRGEDGKQPYLVQWTEGHLGLLYPQTGSVVQAEADTPVPEIVDEVAVARARRHLADELLETAHQDIDALMGEVAQLRPI